MDELLKDAHRKHYAVGAFECWNSDNVHAIAMAAARADAPVIFQASPAEYETMWAGRTFCGEWWKAMSQSII